MAHLLDSQTQRKRLLHPQTLIGRSSTATLQVDGRAASGQHALLRWIPEGWELRDLGSRNGTWMDGRRLDQGERVLVVAGARLGFGEDDGRFVLTDALPPVLAAWPEDGGEPVLAEGGLLGLPPGAELPELQIFRGQDGAWVVERDQVTSPAEETVSAGGRSWTLLLPADPELTLDRDAPSVATIGLRFQVSRDEEFAQMSVLHGAREIPLEARVHHYLLLTLARCRLRDIEQGVPAAAAGWIHQTELARKLRIEEGQVNLQVFRARSQLAEAHVEEAAGVVERRSPGRQLRVGVDRLEVVVV